MGIIMPRFNLPIEEIDEAVLRPVVTHVVNDIMKSIGLDQEVPMVFKGQANQAQYLNAEVNGARVSGNNRHNAKSLLTVEYEVSPNETTLLSTAVNYIENRGIFLDSALRIFLVPVRISKKFEVKMNLSGTEKQIERWQAIIKRKTAQGMMHGLHMPKYHYPIPEAYLGFLCDAHEMRERVGGLGESLGEWFNRCFIPTMRVITDASGRSSTFVIQETQTEVQGWFDFGSGAPQKEKDDESRYSLNMGYTFYFDVPETMNLLTPVAIHNQIIPPEWHPSPTPMADIDYYVKRGTYSQEAMDLFKYLSTSATCVSDILPALSIPNIDDWSESMQPPGYTTTLRVLSRTIETRPRDLIELNSLSPWKLHPLLVSYMRNTKRYIFSPYDNVVTVQGYRYDNLMDQRAMSMSDDMVVSVGEDRDPREVYRTTLAICTSPHLMTDRAYEGLSENGNFFYYWLDTIYPGSANEFGWDYINGDNSISFRDIDRAYKQIQDDYGDSGWGGGGLSDGKHNPIDYSNGGGRATWMLVGRFLITANHEK